MVKDVNGPPLALTFQRPLEALGAKMMIPCELQAPPRPLDAGARVTGGPPAKSIRWSLPLAKKPIDFESGGWTQSLGLPPEVATRATVRPSGEIALPPPTPRRKLPPGGGSILNRRGRSPI